MEQSSPKVTILAIPRERFSNARESLESVLANTHIPYRLVYIDGGSPPDLKQFIEEKSKEHGFTIIRKEYYLSPNEARIIGLKHTNTKYAAFVDNDVVVEPHWLKALVDCAEETKATVVAPLTYEGRPLRTHIHCAGGEAYFKEVNNNGLIEKQLKKRLFHSHKKLSEVPELKREKTGLIEYHCVLLCTDILKKGNVIDEKMKSTMEHIDFCLEVSKLGGLIYFEPSSVVTYVSQPPLEKQDIEYYRVRWNNEWEIESLNHIRQKWGLAEDQFFKNRYKARGFRRKNTLIKPIVDPIIRKIPSWRIRKFIYYMITVFDRIYNRFVMMRYKRLVKQHC
jgi:GT2 family glycosyltransferase